MCLLIETIACRKGQLQNVYWHEKRLNSSRKELLRVSEPISLQHILPPEFTKKGVWKCRIVYKKEIIGISYEPYTARSVQSLALINSNISYSHKFEDREELDALFEQRGTADDVLICKNNRITDTSIGNVVLFDGSSWVTPSKPLLAGTMRDSLLQKGVLEEVDITKGMLSNYKKIMVINALNPFDPSRAFDISKVKDDL